MADNVVLNAGSGGVTLATDDDGTAHHQYVKLEWGGNNTQTPVASGASALPIQDGGNSITIDGTVAVSAVSGNVAITAASLPLPSGAATAAKQPALGTAGTPSSDVITIQGVASMTALTVDATGSGNIPVTVQNASLAVTNSGITTIAGAVSGSEMQVDIVSSALPTGAATAANQSTANTALAAIQTAVEIIDNAISGSEIQADVLTQPARARTTDTISAALATDALMSGTTALTPARAAVNVATSGNNTLVSASSGNHIRVTGCMLVADGNVTVTFQDGAGGTPLSGDIPLTQFSGFTLPFNPTGWMEGGNNTLLNLSMDGAVSVDGVLTYVLVPA